MIKHIRINVKDNVLVALKNLEKGEILYDGSREVKVKEDIKMGHKIAINDIIKDENITKYGYEIGHATKKINSGEHVHCHNVETNLQGIEKYKYNKKSCNNIYKDEFRTFKGYKRKDKSVGVRNELWIVPTVGCVNGTCDKIINKFKEEVKIDDIDYLGVFKHNNGCSQMGDDLIATRNILRNMVRHPNAGGVLVLGLGCEYIQMKEFITSLGEYDESRVRFLVVQEVEDEIPIAVELLKDLYENMKNDKREDISISELKIGLKCGGSDGMSGLTANPLLGEFSDYLVANGGTTILTEVPEMFGAETILMERAYDEEVFNKIVYMINDFKEFCRENKQTIYENPSPGNKDGGITTLEDKSLGCTQKSGYSTVMDVIKYGEVLKKKGLNLLDSPSNDLVASSAQAAAGCQIVLFTTGRGTPFGSFVPTVKISSNTKLYKKKPHWIDFNGGQLTENKTIEEVAKEFIDYVIEVASGEWVNNEKNGFRELAIYKSGVTL
ncbi:UxaA family hydrolase [Clostridium grantii]|uniref:D-altronate dehydratase n=1 Tax=Clostridium grantii DSM 8605 TaxID=1121316 RepID=A0A1M5U2B0_9CLOT|nr:altronate dehydratase family protein [Clostridium grantii]SHH56991.1 D-altronate dehydratase [Clostridium grantii DSM 8605]